jgi:hypothetical protein
MAINPNAPIYPPVDTNLLDQYPGVPDPSSPAYPAIDTDLLPGVPGQRGPRGPQGLPGLDGVQPDELIALVSYTHTQSAASDLWVIRHDLKFRPNITVFDSAGTVVEGHIEHTSENIVTVSLSAEISGQAYLS